MALVESHRNDTPPAACAEVDTFCLFIGYARCGSSIVSALLDAHPRVIISHELDVLRLLARGIVAPGKRDRLYSLILRNSRLQAESGRRQGDYHYAVEEGWQGRFDRLRVIGDKKADWTAIRLLAVPSLLGTLQATVGVRVKFVHTVRHPLDNIATIARKDMRAPGLTTAQRIKLATDLYFDMCTQGALETRARVGQDCWHTVYHEDLVEAPERVLTALCDFLGQPAPPEYLARCAAIVNAAPHRSRTLIEWPARSEQEVRERMAAVDFLGRYR